MAVPFLKLTKLQKQILFEFVRQQGFAEGVQKLYQRLKRDIGSIQHPAMDSDKSGFDSLSDFEEPIMLR